MKNNEDIIKIKKIHNFNEDGIIYNCMDKYGNTFCTDIKPSSNEFKEKFKDIL